jgi:hypothetical protein
MRLFKTIGLLALLALLVYAFTTVNHVNFNNNNNEVTLTSTPGTLQVTTLTSGAGGNYAPRNIVAVWVEDSNGVFVKTLLAYANTYKQYLTHWKVKSQYNTTDAISGPTVNSHATRTCNWNGKNTSGVVVPDGKYRICFELTDKNATGNYSYFEIIKDAQSHTLTPANVSSFSNISITWTPDNSPNSVDEQDITMEAKLYPNPNNGQFKIDFNQVPQNASIEFYNNLGQLIMTQSIADNQETFDISGYKGLVFYTITSNQKMVNQGKFIIK